MSVFGQKKTKNYKKLNKHGGLDLKEEKEGRQEETEVLQTVDQREEAQQITTTTNKREEGRKEGGEERGRKNKEARRIE